MSFTMKRKMVKQYLARGDNPQSIVKALSLSENDVEKIIKVKEWMEKRKSMKDRINAIRNETGLDENVKSKRTDVMAFENAVLKWLFENKDKSLFNILEQAETFASKILVVSKNDVKVSQNWFTNFRRKHKLDYKTAEELEKIESRKLAKKMKVRNTREPDFVWGQCDGCDGVDCPVHDWGSRPKITPRKMNQKQGGSNPLSTALSNPSPVLPVGTYCSPYQQKTYVIEVPAPTSCSYEETNIQNNSPVDDEENGSDCDSDSSHFVIAEDEAEEMQMDENLIKTEESVISFGNEIHRNSEDLLINDGTLMNCDKVNKICDNSKADETLIPIISLDSDDSEQGGNDDKIKEAIDLLQKGLTIIDKYDDVIERKTRFKNGLRQLLAMYNYRK